ncbi:hypothetical protein GQ43DRAFT_20062 [Delitschia confertaspora ATCC 74209]|uniref:Uncharacterized protein n=1 Tax=Delitschia confertaspora ATCC 74209 TaxID=1513339 RepID=A0A9P4JP52_9PLEO|nr:hypothetical protein GQ43DRAFT_20062 [Delitschia confertaspora ATCC 74209]
MDNLSNHQRVSRINLRHRRSAREIKPEGGSKEDIRERKSVLLAEEEELSGVDEPLLAREKQGRKVMRNKHYMFHHRQAEQPSQSVMVVTVDVVATLDDGGNVVGSETVFPSNALPTVPPVTAVPTVPAVPPFPHDLTVPAVPAVPTVNQPTVPAYPFPSGVSSAEVQEVTSQIPLSAPAPTNVPTSLPLSSGSNSTSTSSTKSPSGISYGVSSTPSAPASASRSGSASSSPSSASSGSPTESPSSASSGSPTESPSSSFSGSSSFLSSSGSEPSATSYVVVGGGPANTADPPAATSSTASNDSSSGGDPAPISTPKVVGSVVGSLAGAALILALILILLRRYKRKHRGGALQLPGQDAGDSQPIAVSGQEMAVRRSHPSSAPFFSRFSVTSRSTADTSTTGERGFQRISGRKLPSAFSEGMTSEQFEREGALSGSSFYRDDSGFYGGPGALPGSTHTGQLGSAAGTMGTKERIMPSPARTPVIHHPDDVPPFGANQKEMGGRSKEVGDSQKEYGAIHKEMGGSDKEKGSYFRAPQSPPRGTPSPRGTLGRSHPSFDGSRVSSKFTEDV